MADTGNVVPMQRPSERLPIARDAARPSETWLTAQVVAMLSIYYQPDEDPDIVKLGLGLWVDCLSDLPRDAIERAIRSRLSSPSRSRPVPGEIRALALRELQQPERACTPPPFGPPDLTPAERERVSTMLRGLLGELGAPGAKTMHEGSCERIVRVVSEVTGVPLVVMCGDQRSQEAVRARYLAALLCRRHTAASVTVIGIALGRRDHSTVLRGASCAEARIASDGEWSALHAEIERRLAE